MLFSRNFSPKYVKYVHVWLLQPTAPPATLGPGAVTPTGLLHTSHPPLPPPCLHLHTHTHTSAPTHPYSRTSPWIHANAVSRRFQ